MTRITASGDFDLEQTITDTYFSLRWGMVFIAVALPLVLWGGGHVFYDIELQSSLSAYYLTDMRNWFVGALFAISACLYLYKGLSDRENYFLNTAAILATGIAVSPLNWHPAFFPEKLTPHGIFAVSFFAMIALACWLCQDDSLKLGLIPPDQQRRYRAKYAAIGVALVALPALAVLINIGVFGRPFDSSVFWIEAVAMWVYAYYWQTKSGELKLAIEKRMGRRAVAAKA